MAKNSEKNTKNNKNTNPIPSATQSPDPKVSQSKPQEESHGGLIAAIVALVALIIIGGGILAFVLLVKAKNKYIDPITKPKTGLEEGLSIGTTNPSTGEASEIVPEIPIIPGSTAPDMPTAPDTPITPDIPTTPDIPEPEKVGSYDFEGVIAEMDGAMNGASDATFNNTIYSNDYFGF